MDQYIVLIIGTIIILLFFVNINNFTYINNYEKFESGSLTNMNKNMIDIYLDNNKKIYEYIFNKKIINRQKNKSTQPQSMTAYYDKIKLRINELFTLNNCGYIYNYYETSNNIPGSMYIIDTKIIFSYQDKNNKDGLYDVLNKNDTLIISDGITTYQLIKEKVDIDPITNIITVYIDPKTFKEDYNINIDYILYPCSTLEHISNTPSTTPSITPSNAPSIPKNPLFGDYSIQQAIVDSNVNISFLIYLGLVFLIMVVYNWEFFYNVISNYFFKNKNSKNKFIDSDLDLDEEYSIDMNNIYYVGGYDYKDYSE
jgi:hypothetical protein